MVLRKLLRGALIACFVPVIWTASAFAQDRPPLLPPSADPNEVSCAPDDLAILTPPVAETRTIWEQKPKPTIDLAPLVTPGGTSFLNFQPRLLAAIDQRLGSRYRWGANGPNRFDCSGFVWSIFQSVGISFERGSARTLFARFTPASTEEQYKFGTLVFFSGLSHVGVVADEHGFYHASRRQGVIYSPFNEYWLKRIDGFRRVPLPAEITN